MTDHKDLKDHIRARMEKTGEKYTAARRHVLAGRGTEESALVRPVRDPDPTLFDEKAFWTHFQRSEPSSSEVLRWCKEFVARFDEPGTLLRACAAMMTASLRAYATDGLRESKHAMDALSILGEKSARAGAAGDPPGTDHSSVWENDGKPEAFISQPYNLDMDTLGKMIAYCRRHGLTFAVRGGSWYFPGATVLVEFKARKDGK